MLRVDAAQQLALVVAQGDRMISLARARLPCRLLARQHDRKTVEVGHEIPVPLLIEGKQARLVRKQLADSDVLLAVLGEFRPVAADALLVVEPAAGVGQCERHRGQALGGRVDQDHGVLLPRLAGRLVAHAAPQVNDLLAPVIHATGAAQFVAQGEILGECIAHGLEACAYMPLDTNALRCFHGTSRC